MDKMYFQINFKDCCCQSKAFYIHNRTILCAHLQSSVHSNAIRPKSSLQSRLATQQRQKMKFTNEQNEQTAIGIVHILRCEAIAKMRRGFNELGEWWVLICRCTLCQIYGFVCGKRRLWIAKERFSVKWIFNCGFLIGHWWLLGQWLGSAALGQFIERRKTND